jgi:hypothetical protein
MKAVMKPWQLSLLAAVLLHLIALTGWQIARRRQPAPERLRAADDTPILLQFSRETPLPQEMGSIPLPPASSLPPPIGGEAPTPATLPGLGRGPGKRNGTPHGLAPTARQPQGQVGSRPGATSASARLVRPKGSGTAGAQSAPAPLPLNLGAGSPARLALEKGLHDARSASTEEGQATGRDDRVDPRSAAGSPGQEVEAKASAGDLARPVAGGTALRATPADLRLWALAQSRRPPSGSVEGLPEGLALRELSLSQARGSGADIRHRRLVRLDDGVLLLWVEGSSVWLVRAPLP